MPNPLHDKLLTLDEERVAKLYQTVFGSGEGQLVLEDLRNRCFVKTSTFEGFEPISLINEGKRTVVLHIETQINYEPVDPEKVSQE